MARELKLQNLWVIMRHILRSSNAKGKEICVQKTADRLGYGCARALFGQNWSTVLKELSANCNHKFTVIAECFEKQCSFLLAQRLKRATQIMAFYNRLYGEKLIDQVGNSLLRRFHKKSLFCVLAATLFSWEENKIGDDALNRSVYDMVHIQELVRKTRSQVVDESCPWEKVIDRPHLIVWRRPLEFNSSLFQYKVYGKFDDVPARAFFNTQVDLEFWQQWDKLSLDIRIIDKHEESGSEVVHWTSEFPYPMYSRDYVYVRRYMVDTSNKIMAMYSQTVNHPICPVQDNIVRVTEFQSALVIKPYSDFDENGLEYVLTYYDDPQTTFPTVCYNWIATTGVPEFVDKLHKASKMMHERTQKGYRPAYYQNQNQNSHSTFTLNQTQYA
ncbi:stAR-related lipid transfer protein 7, mitochondrial-like [Haliotis rubra]|uniref:stAR-related lipid transfer protein 7, mitochondrial-like n=1 Tax=Haliotis rubra TaxID=36100 RepID=UPI001EE61068|nr:stAR-related lipid transfer protein 7, mitochondrial-like [Haliotis rubra]